VPYRIVARFVPLVVRIAKVAKVAITQSDDHVIEGYTIRNSTDAMGANGDGLSIADAARQSKARKAAAATKAADPFQLSKCKRFWIARLFRSCPTSKKYYSASLTGSQTRRASPKCPLGHTKRDTWIAYGCEYSSISRRSY
jgi:hypothetical protein